VIHPEDGRFVEELVERLIEGTRRGQIAPEGFFDDNPRVFGTAGRRESFRDLAEKARRNGQVVQRPRRCAERLAEPFERRGLAIVTGYVLEPFEQWCMGIDVRAGVVLEAFLNPRAKLVEGPTGAREADDRDRQTTGAPESGERGEKSVDRRDRPSRRTARRRRTGAQALVFSSCPPN
jgi:hypothetical protein